MSSGIPVIWLWVSGLFFFVGIAVFAATLALLLKILKMAEELQPKVDSLTTKVEVLLVKLDKVADRVEETMVSVKTTVDGVGGRATGIMGSVETFTRGTSTRLEGFAPIITGVMAAYKLFTVFKAARSHAKPKTKSKALLVKKK